MFLPYHETPVTELQLPITIEKGVRLLVKHEYRNHPTVSGNKWWKLKYNVIEAVSRGKTSLLTFGGAYSNHIYAVAAAAREIGLTSLGVIRGEQIKPLNGTLAFAQAMGMQLHFVSRSLYREKNEPEFIRNLGDRYGDFYLIPEGGTNALAVKGVAEFARELKTVAFDRVFVPIGTAGTFAGMIAGLNGDKFVTGVPVLKLGEDLTGEVDALVTSAGYEIKKRNWDLLRGYHFGGYARVSDELIDFIREMKYRYNLPLDHVYTGKMLFAILREIAADSFPRGTTVLAIHTGGLQAALQV